MCTCVHLPQYAVPEPSSPVPWPTVWPCARPSAASGYSGSLGHCLAMPMTARPRALCAATATRPRVPKASTPRRYPRGHWATGSRSPRRPPQADVWACLRADVTGAAFPGSPLSQGERGTGGTCSYQLQRMRRKGRIKIRIGTISGNMFHVFQQPPGGGETPGRGRAGPGPAAPVPRNALSLAMTLEHMEHVPDNCSSCKKKKCQGKINHN